ncbi:tetratricopeptide repeat protein [Burkholderia lata]|uniref:protein O-GlcNAc transferase n=1 Tax=Burkholderia lata (strain ATCC 17760 / DSM 23089 / LMG 22485 / NCIMB 9086 / R18194 / 383) TaxID=482957 RepID=A0A6P2RQL5_BURL3|nr:tetratricopeptide repeat protein [Burkholderia lata]VWC37974.1 TPR domain-containing protein [Burkholderia lata]
MHSPDSSISAPTPEQQLEQDIALVLQNAIERHHAGAYEDARALYEAILGAMPEHANANYNLAVLKVETGDSSSAIPHFEIALGAAPYNGNYWVSYINALFRSEQTSAAWIAVEMAQQRGVHGPALDGLIAQMAAPSIVFPTAPAAPAAATLNLSLVALPANDTTPVAPTTNRPILQRVPPRKLQSHTALFNKGRIAEAIALAREFVAKYPADSASWRALTVSLYRDRRYRETIDAAYRLIEREPDDVMTRTLLAEALRVADRATEAEAQCRHVISVQPDNAEGHRILGLVLNGLRRHGEAIAACRRAVELAPQVASMHSALGFLLLDQGASLEAIQWFRRAIEINPMDSITHSSLLFCLIHDDSIDADMLMREHRTFAKLHEARVKPPRHANARAPHRKLRVGFVSGDLMNHAVASYLAPVVHYLGNDPSLSLHFYSNHLFEDHITAQLREKAETWTDVTVLDDAALVGRIRRDRIDILIDLSGHTGRNRLTAFAHKPAPVQASWIGYAGTTGLTALDYYLTDRFVAPPGLLDSQFVEKIVHLPAVAPFSPPPHCPPINALPALHAGHVTYGSFNRLNKLRPDVIALWAKILRADPHARMVIGAIGQEHDRYTLIDWFAAEGIAVERLSFRPRAPTAVYLQQHHQVDICLDTFPYAGSTTTLNALWMGVPTVTIAGRSLPSRGSACWLSHLGLEQFIAHDTDDFVERALELSKHLDELNVLRTSMRDRCLASAAFQPETIAAGLSSALRTMWARWCSDETPISFDATASTPGVVTHPV